MRTGRFIVIDGIDGSGKSTVTAAALDWARSRGRRVFDLNAWCKEKGTIPRFEEVADCEVFFTAEPTRTWVGSAIRAMIVAGHENYTGLEQAHAFSLDRLTLYRRLILPALEAGRTVIQDRSVSTSIIYQPMMPGGPTLDELLALPGNRLAMEHRPDHLIITCVPPEKAIGRLPKRVGGDEKQVFEEIDRLKSFDERYRSAWFKSLFAERGTELHLLDTDCSIDESRDRAVRLVYSLLAPKSQQTTIFSLCHDPSPSASVS